MENVRRDHFVKAGFVKGSDVLVGFVKKTKQVGQEDPRRIIHSVKMGLALSLISLVYYFRPLYDGFGVSTMWAVLTVVVVFEFTVGATLSKGLNRGFATFLAGGLGVGAHHLATFAGETGEPILLGSFVFILATAASFSRFFPAIKARYDYGVLVFILTFSLVSVSGYRVDRIVELAHQRLSTILIGGLTCVLISVGVCPVWAGEELHNLVATNMEKLGEFLQGFGDEFFESKENDQKSDEIVSKDDKSFLQRYKSVLNSKTSEESFANFASWEPGHGGFKFRHPWTQYLAIGILTRQCACRIEALNSYINSPLQATPEFKKKIQKSCKRISSESGEALVQLAISMRTMTQSAAANIHVMNSKMACSNLKTTMNAALLEEPELLKVVPAVSVASLLLEIIECTEKIVESVNELAGLAEFKREDTKIIPKKSEMLQHGVAMKPVCNTAGSHVIIIVQEPRKEKPDSLDPSSQNEAFSDPVTVSEKNSHSSDGKFEYCKSHEKRESGAVDINNNCTDKQTCMKNC
ncbi:hypothetical protein Scep_003431 [Stephania cephalantha]|uniref:Aluminum-activated malate transporter n=1 Tax=Stephania cephalantha TaxID=152367 RepID=A0AAP0KSH2_9MAGN